jgi:hypothetical protein
VVRHIVMWRLQDRDALTTTSAKWAELQACVAEMRTGIPGLAKVDLGMDAPRTADSTDLILFSEFDSWASLDAYQAHPIHEDFKKLLGPLRTERRVGDYEI